MAAGRPDGAVPPAVTGGPARARGELAQRAPDASARGGDLAGRLLEGGNQVARAYGRAGIGSRRPPYVPGAGPTAATQTRRAPPAAVARSLTAYPAVPSSRLPAATDSVP